MRYLVTGGGGFIGSHLVGELLRRGADVVVLDDFSTGRRENLEPYLGQFRLIEGSITEPDTCAASMEGVDFVLHQAALPSVPRSIQNPIATHEICATGTLNVLRAAKDAGVRRLVYAGSSSAYGDTPTLPKTESMPPRPRSPYAVAKLAGEHYCQAFHAAYGFESVVLRYFNIFGPRQDPGSPYGAVIPKFISAALSGVRPRINGTGEQTRDFTYVANAVHANLLACESPAEGAGRPLNVGCGDRVSINELWALVRKLTGAEVDPTYHPARPGDVRDSLACLEDSRSLLGYEPLVNLEEGLRETVAAMTGGNTTEHRLRSTASNGG